jgi:hypothetical protein
MRRPSRSASTTEYLAGSTTANDRDASRVRWSCQRPRFRQRPWVGCRMAGRCPPTCAAVRCRPQCCRTSRTPRARRPRALLPGSCLSLTGDRTARDSDLRRPGSGRKTPRSGDQWLALRRGRLRPSTRILRSRCPSPSILERRVGKPEHAAYPTTQASVLLAQAHAAGATRAPMDKWQYHLLRPMPAELMREMSTDPGQNRESLHRRRRSLPGRAGRSELYL